MQGLTRFAPLTRGKVNPSWTLQLGRNLIRDVEVVRHGLHVVVFLKKVDQPHLLLDLQWGQRRHLTEVLVEGREPHARQSRQIFHADASGEFLPEMGDRPADPLHCRIKLTATAVSAVGNNVVE